MTSALGLNNPQQGWDLTNFPDFLATVDNGEPIDINRKLLNDFIRSSGLFDGVVEFDGATLDPATGNMKAEFVPNSQFTQSPWDYLHPNHAGYNAMGMAVDIRPFAPSRHRWD
jgi:hypothetical protein